MGAKAGQPPRSRLRLVTETEPRPPEPPDGSRYTSRLGVVWVLHQGTTRTGKPKYFVAKSAGPGALGAMPAGFEFTESINAVVSVRRIDPTPSRVAEGDLQLVRQELARHQHLGHYRVQASRTELVIYEPQGGVRDQADVRESARMLGIPLAAYARAVGKLTEEGRFAPVMCFEAPAGPGDTYSVKRMTYRGRGGWSYPLASGSLPKLVREFVPPIGTEAFFELN